MNYKTFNGLQEAKHYITELIPKEEQGRYHKEIFDAIDSATKILESQSDTYTLVLWPKSQAYMDEPWFDEYAILADAESIGEVQAYFIPNEYIKS
jgi:hypothetical protein